MIACLFYDNERGFPDSTLSAGQLEEQSLTVMSGENKSESGPEETCLWRIMEKHGLRWR